mmetsp:Transcript_40610/g.81443  ORF Transcript_40610/g.81443 Transcript_40610/m.81443 type:complete len:153 (-) Transcript_40610:36-494(-)|eukprot:CAMPEP_0174720288 /NCGR_PEP_ID=MMETSP1094-20130205/33209_1 /TAXON_ID=156173 /ORGANISM="Chrysochromulina brevifilum, Strain UTEX LB 985" /LENGTH=152 /DNA_ID=CAMNT_0015920753 /DNA_START=1 /DNA_END=459 /DNA_ORIENTATION=+
MALPPPGKATASPPARASGSPPPGAPLKQSAGKPLPPTAQQELALLRELNTKKSTGQTGMSPPATQMNIGQHDPRDPDGRKAALTNAKGQFAAKFISADNLHAKARRWRIDKGWRHAKIPTADRAWGVAVRSTVPNPQTWEWYSGNGKGFSV